MIGMLKAPRFVNIVYPQHEYRPPSSKIIICKLHPRSYVSHFMFVAKQNVNKFNLTSTLVFRGSLPEQAIQACSKTNMQAIKLKLKHWTEGQGTQGCMKLGQMV